MTRLLLAGLAVAAILAYGPAILGDFCAWVGL